MLKPKKFTQKKKFIPRTDRKEEQAKERERMAEALAAYHRPITKCPPTGASRELSASNRIAKSRPPS